MKKKKPLPSLAEHAAPCCERETAPAKPWGGRDTAHTLRPAASLQRAVNVTGTESVLAQKQRSPACCPPTKARTGTARAGQMTHAGDEHARPGDACGAADPSAGCPAPRPRPPGPQ
ncbi:peptide YY isoform X1 [Heterocephalus glaber]|uniref:Peptide YY isoform X1 n=1 Tax=Heterocephalus glaber TaxID=10181 RepID=A0AAX6RJN9_HETGA|nr:peptide YY isoform X1 [Heterocephalus glaber]